MQSVGIKSISRAKGVGYRKEMYMDISAEIRDWGVGV